MTNHKSVMSTLKAQKKALRRQLRRETAKAKKLANLRDEVKALSVQLDQARGDVHFQEQRFFGGVNTLDAE